MAERRRRYGGDPAYGGVKPGVIAKAGLGSSIRISKGIFNDTCVSIPGSDNGGQSGVGGLQILNLARVMVRG